MTYFDFRDLVLAMAKHEGQSYLTVADAAPLRALIQEQLDVYCERVGCCSSDALAFTPKTGVDRFRLSDLTVFGRPVAEVRRVAIASAWIEPTSGVDMARDLAYLGTPAGRPVRWWIETPDVLRFDRAFDQVYAGCYVAGILFHTPITSDLQELDLAPADIRPAARLCAAELLFPHSPETALAFRRVALEEMEGREDDHGARRSGPSRRRALDRRTVRLD